MTLTSRITTFALAGLITTTVAAEPQWQMLVQAERVHQSFNDGDSDIDTFILSPAVQFQHWTLSASLPWQHVNGSYFVNNANPNLEYVCNQVNGLSPAQKLLLVRRGTLTAQQLQYCDQTNGVETDTVQDSVDGFSDLELFANYYLPFLHDNISGTVGIGYKHDNGDADAGLGTGTQDAFVETSWYWSVAPVSALATLGYEHLLGNSTSIDLEDYAYASLDARWQLHDQAALGVEYHYRQANVDVLDDLDYLTYYLRLGRSTGWGARLFMTDYQDRTGYPEQEFGGSLSYAF